MFAVPEVSLRQWVEIEAAAGIPEGSGRSVRAGERRLAVFRHDGRWFALDDACPHQGASLGEGLFHGGRVICPLHGWVFEVATGRCPRDSHEGVRTYPVRRTERGIEVQLS